MNSRKLFSLIVLSALCVPALSQADSKADEIIKKVREKYDKLSTLEAEFEQVFSWELAGETQRVKGTLYLNDKDQYRIETGTQLIVTDGSTVWTYSEGDNQVIIDRVGGTTENQLPRELLLQYSKDYRATYIGEEEIEGRKAHLLQLKPREEDPYITSLKVWIDPSDWYTRKIEQIDLNENVNTYHIRNIKVDEAFATTLFSFDIPADAEVVDLREAE